MMEVSAEDGVSFPPYPTSVQLTACSVAGVTVYITGSLYVCPACHCDCCQGTGLPPASTRGDCRSQEKKGHNSNSHQRGRGVKWNQTPGKQKMDIARSWSCCTITKRMIQMCTSKLWDYMPFQDHVKVKVRVAAEEETPSNFTLMWKSMDICRWYCTLPKRPLFNEIKVKSMAAQEQMCWPSEYTAICS